MTRRLEVDPERIDRWVEGFEGRHGHTERVADGPRLLLRAADGARASLQPFTATPPPPRPPVLTELTRWATPPDSLGLILVRRGGYAVASAERAILTAHKCGTRYVQSRTAAGGWSQQRYARRRGHQADALVAAVAGHVLRLLVSTAGVSPDALVVGGDRGLVRDVLADRRLAALVELPRRELFDLPDPRLEVLRSALRRGRAVRIELAEPATGD